MQADAPPITPHMRDPWPTPWSLWVGLAAAPLAWAVQGLVGWWISSEACAGGTTRLGTASSVRSMLIALTAVALVVALSGAAAAYREFRKRREGGPEAALLRQPGSRAGLVGTDLQVRPHHHEPLEQFTGRYRPGFMALAGLLISSVFAVAILLAGIASTSVSVCENAR